MLICSLFPTVLPSYLPSSLPSSVQSFHSSSLSQISLRLWFFIWPFPTSRTHLPFPTLHSLSHSLPVFRPPVSSVLHLSFFLHVSWHCCCVPNVLQTRFFTIKLLLLPSPAAARITWAEQALLNIEQHREGGTQSERGREEGREERRIIKKEKRRNKERKMGNKNKTDWEGDEMGKETTTITLKDPHLPLVS